MTTENTPYAAAAMTSLQNIQLPKLASHEQRIATAGLYAVTYAILDLAAAIREQGSR
jgi:hypothetical protein